MKGFSVNQFCNIHPPAHHRLAAAVLIKYLPDTSSRTKHSPQHFPERVIVVFDLRRGERTNLNFFGVRN